MRRMFASATLQLTASYLIILIVISLLFSFIIYELSTAEISRRLEGLQIRVEGSTRTLTLPGPVTLNDIRADQTEEAKANIFIGLLYMNFAVIGLGGVGSYLFARQTLKPIEEAHEAQSRFAADASHELRTPLAVMKSEIQVAMRDSTMTKNDYRELLESNLEEVDKMTQLSHSLLQLSRLEFGDVDRNQRVDIAKTIERAIKSQGVLKKRIVMNAPSQSIIVDGNESTLVDLFQILLDNAVKYSPPDTKIRFQLSSNGRTCKIHVTNEGKGIEPDDIPKIFDRFYRTIKSRTSLSMPQGYGLGLSLAHKIVDIHDGTISVVSTPGKTTTFTVALPQVRKNR